jgi:hypothetical protein
MREFAELHTAAWLPRSIDSAGLAMLFAVLLAFLARFGNHRFNAIGRLGD